MAPEPSLALSRWLPFTHSTLSLVPQGNLFVLYGMNIFVFSAQHKTLKQRLLKQDVDACAFVLT